MEIVIATKNKKKLKEIKEILGDLGLKFVSLLDYAPTLRIREDGKSFRENAVKKALQTARFTGRFSLGEDSGLCVDELGGAPGIYSSRFAGRNKSDRQNNLKLLRLLRGRPLYRRKAHYVCAVALADQHGLVGVAEGSCYGVIGLQPKGSRGFGYDPLFLMRGSKKTFAQLGEEIKHKFSHRFRALKKARRLLEKYIERQQRG